MQPIWPLGISWCFHAVTLAYWWRLFILSLLCRGSRPSKNIGVSQNLAQLDTNFFQHICALTTYKVPEMSKISNCTRVKETSTGRRSKHRCKRRPLKCGTLFWPAIYGDMTPESLAKIILIIKKHFHQWTTTGSTWCYCSHNIWHDIVVKRWLVFFSFLNFLFFNVFFSHESFMCY